VLHLGVIVLIIILPLFVFIRQQSLFVFIHIEFYGKAREVWNGYASRKCDYCMGLLYGVIVWGLVGLREDGS